MRTIHLLASTVVLLAACAGNGNDTGASRKGRDNGKDNGAAAAQSPTGDPAPSVVARHPVPIDGLPAIGAPDALVTLVEFTDYDCGYCARLEATLHALRAKYGAELRVVVAAHPLPMHPRARDAALAALAVADDPARFERVQSALFEGHEPRSAVDLARLVLASGADPLAFDRAMTGGAAEASLARAEALATTLHVRGTPTSFVNGRKVIGAQPFAVLDGIVAEELAHARDLVASGVAPAQVYATLLDEARADPAPCDADDARDEPSFVPAALHADGAAYLGRSDAPTTLVVFADFACPFSRRFDAELRAFVDSHRDVRVAFRNRPLPMHEQARLAAKAAIAADAQGKLPAMAAGMFAHQDALDRSSLVAHATAAGLDADRFALALESPETEARLAEDEALADSLGARGTPTSFVAGQRIVGAQPPAVLEQALTPAPR